MAKVLIHYNTDGEPMGIWRQGPDGSMQSFYPAADKKWVKRGKAIVDDREPDRNIDDFFDHLTEHSSYFDHFGTIEAQDNEPMDSIWYRAKTTSYED